MKRVFAQVALLAFYLLRVGQAQSLGQSLNPSQSPDVKSSSLLPQNGDNTQERSGSERATIRGTVTDTNEQPVSGATVRLEDAQLDDVRTATTDGLGFFELPDIEPGIRYHVIVSAPGFALWDLPSIILKPGQHEVLDVNKLRIEELQTTVIVSPETTDEMAIEQVRVEEKQRGFGIIPNFFAVYDPNPAPLRAKLKFDLALKAVRDPFTLGGVAVLAGVGQAANNPAYVQGLRGYGERFGSNYANQFTSVMIGGAILPSLLRQDPRYFYKGTGSKTSRAFHALSYLFITKGDNGRIQPNYSSLGGDLASGAIATTYYPEQNEAVRYVFESFAINTAVHAAVRLLQEFAFRPEKGTVVSNSGRLTPSP